MSQVICRPFVMAVVRPSLSSMPSTVQREVNLIKRGHNDIRDHDAKLADLAWGGVTVELALVPADDRNSRPVLQADWSARGVWEGNLVALFDNRIVDANAPSYQRSSWDAIARKAAEAKRKKYAQASEELRSSFTRCLLDGCRSPPGVHGLPETPGQPSRYQMGQVLPQSWWPGPGSRRSPQSSASLTFVFVGHVAAL